MRPDVEQPGFNSIGMEFASASASHQLLGSSLLPLNRGATWPISAYDPGQTGMGAFQAMPIPSFSVGVRPTVAGWPCRIGTVAVNEPLSYR